jgi:serine O-acetyltransferase
MIKNRKDYRRYLEEDKHHLFSKEPSIKERLTNKIWKYERLLRKCEYLRNTSNLPSPYYNPIYIITKLKFNRLGLLLGFSISENCFDGGLSIAHYGSIVVNPGARIGKNCRIHVGVNIGSAATNDGVPIIGNNVYIGPGAKIFGNISIGDNTVIGANAVVNTSFPDGGVTIAGIPARVISNKDSNSILIRNSY